MDAPKLKDLGETALLERFSPIFKAALPENTVGIGDDAALIPPLNADEREAITTDLLVEGIHFRLDWTGPEDLGVKALAVNLSDLAAMGAEPLSAFLSLALPPYLELAWFDRFIGALGDYAREQHVHILGGDLCASPRDIFINVTLRGRVRADRAKLRSGARAGDFLYVTGPLGDSGAALGYLLAGEDPFRMDAPWKTLLQRHRRPAPHLAEGRWLGEQAAVHALMDVSDGIHQDLPRLLRASGCSAEVEVGKLPVSPEFEAACSERGWDALRLAAGAGEDYCLLAAVEAKDGFLLETNFLKKFGRPLYPIGFVTEGAEGLRYTQAGKRIALDLKSFEHFR